MSPLNTTTKRVLAILAGAAFAYEMAALVAGWQPITTAMVELGCVRPWVPYWLAALLAHFFYPRRDNKGGALQVFLLVSAILTITWEVGFVWRLGYAGWFCERMWLPALAGCVAGHLGFTRPILPEER